MLRNALFTCSIIIALLNAPRAFALSYSGSAAFDTNSLQFDFLADTSVQLSNLNQTHFVSVTGGGLSETHSLSESGWSNQSLIATAPTVADNEARSVTNFTPPGFIWFASGGLVVPGAADASITHGGIITAPSEGVLMLSIGYRLITAGIPTPISGFNTNVFAGMSLGAALASDQLNALSGDTTKTGIFSLQRFLGAGESVPFNFTASVASSVPEPDTLWPTLVGLAGIAIVARRRRNASLDSLSSAMSSMR
jgi:hypothetical protein